MASIIYLKKNDYRALFSQFMKDLDGDGLIMCHPAHHADTPQEFFRVNEFNTLIKKST